MADEVGNLTDTAQQVLRSEMKSRGLSETQAAKKTPEIWRDAKRIQESGEQRSREFRSHLWGCSRCFRKPCAADRFRHSRRRRRRRRSARVHMEDPPLRVRNIAGSKTSLCSLNRAGIECWIEGARTGIGLANPRVLVAADLNSIRRRQSPPTPSRREILDDSKIEAPGV